MSRPTALPVYLQISERLSRDIIAGRIPDGSKLPTEREMAEELGVAVGTLRKALKTLEERGLIKRIQGSGNYVCFQSDPQSVYAFFNLELPGGGGLPTADILSVDFLDKDEDLPSFGTSDQGLRIRRLRYLSDQLVAIEEIWLDGSFYKPVEKTALSDSLYLYYRTALDLVITRAEDHIGMNATPDWVPEPFARPGQIMVFIERFGWSQDQILAEYSRTWFNPEHARYISRMS